jgi:hypothetical protein
VDIDLNQLREMHGNLSPAQALIMVERAAFALERNAHKSGVRLSIDLA